MSGDNYYLLSALPGLDDLGSPPPMTPESLLEQVRGTEGNCVVLEALFISDDLLQRQAFLSGEVDEVEPVVLTPSQVRDEEPLPEVIDLPAEENATRSSIDAVWESYFIYAASIANEQRSVFFQKWVEYEVGLRNALVRTLYLHRLRKTCKTILTKSMRLFTQSTHAVKQKVRSLRTKQ